jgi:hypothetical protein
MVVKSSTWALAGMSNVNTIASASLATVPIFRMAGFSVVVDTFFSFLDGKVSPLICSD